MFFIIMASRKRALEVIEDQHECKRRYVDIGRVWGIVNACVGGILTRIGIWKESTLSFDDLSNELLLHIFHYVGIGKLMTLLLTCKRWNQLLNSQSARTTLCKQWFGTVPFAEELDWRFFFDGFVERHRVFLNGPRGIGEISMSLLRGVYLFDFLEAGVRFKRDGQYKPGILEVSEMISRVACRADDVNLVALLMHFDLLTLGVGSVKIYNEIGIAGATRVASMLAERRWEEGALTKSEMFGLACMHRQRHFVHVAASLTPRCQLIEQLFDEKYVDYIISMLLRHDMKVIDDFTLASLAVVELNTYGLTARFSSIVDAVSVDARYAIMPCAILRNNWIAVFYLINHGVRADMLYVIDAISPPSHTAYMLAKLYNKRYIINGLQSMGWDYVLYDGNVVRERKLSDKRAIEITLYGTVVLE